ncbi:MAG: hypothetical protein Ct9H300mP14_00870 [Gammaproteobacteria bacterium]|nr:MAG: hypothetical protein Ct9H300mP14_00870 [Gammaproteobacteria bacterium]
MTGDTLFCGYTTVYGKAQHAGRPGCGQECDQRHGPIVSQIEALSELTRGHLPGWCGIRRRLCERGAYTMRPSAVRCPTALHLTKSGGKCMPWTLEIPGMRVQVDDGPVRPFFNRQRHFSVI